VSKQEPDAWMFEVNDIVDGWIKYVDFKKLDGAKNYQPLYAVPPKREWVGLTNDEEIFKEACKKSKGTRQWSFLLGARWAEQILKEKNT
jgi:hypothetical protein